MRHDIKCPFCGQFVPFDSDGYYARHPERAGEDSAEVQCYCSVRCYEAMVSQSVRRALLDARARGMSVREIGRKTGVHYNTANSWLNEARTPNALASVNLARALDITVDALLCREEP